MNICDFCRSVGAGSATTLYTRGLTRSVIALIVPPFPAFEHDDDSQALRLDPFLDIAELGLELPQLLLVGFALHPAVLLLGRVLGLFLGFFHENACCNAGPIMTLR